MLATYSWLKEYAHTDLAPEAAAERLTAQGLEVAHLTRLRPAIAHLAVGLIRSCEKHPGADRLSVCQVETTGGTLQIVCGAPNARAGLKVCVALVGATLPGDFTIKKAKIRGVESSGMLCSRSELGLEAESAGIWELPEATDLATPLSTLIGPEDHLFDIEVTSNRGDALSIMGVALELSVATGSHFNQKKHKKYPEKKGTVPVHVHAREACTRYMARLVTGVQVGPSPEWLRTRLSDHGLRSINNVVDVTNLILLEYGQPLHAFDFQTLAGKTIHVRGAKPGETLVLLDGKKLELRPEDTVIADAEKPVALAGIMGGLDTGVTQTTKEVLIEAACFDPAGIRRTRTHHKVSSDSSARFEKGVSWDRVEEALHYAVELLCDPAIAHGAASSSVMDQHGGRPKEGTVVFRYSKVKERLALDLGPVETNKIFNQLGFIVKAHDAMKGQIVIPFHRRDIAHEWDLLEEVARIHGYGKIPEALPRVANSNDKVLRPDERPWRESLRGLGWSEAMNLAFADSRVLTRLRMDTAGHVPVQNPMSPDFTFLRADLRLGLLGNVKHNQEHVRGRGLKLYEAGRIFSRQKGEDREVRALGLIACGPLTPANWATPSRRFDGSDLIGDLEAFFRAMGFPTVTVEPTEDARYSPLARGRLLAAGIELGRFGRIRDEEVAAFDLTDGDVWYAELDLDRVAEARGRVPAIAPYRPYSTFPGATRDLAFVLPRDVSPTPLAQAMAKAHGDIQSVTVSDIFTGSPVGPTHQSVVYAIAFSNAEKTLTKEELDGTVAQLVQLAETRFGAKPRA